MKRTRDVATVRKIDRITVEVARETMELFEIDDHGLDAMDRKILRTMIELYGGGPVGLKALAASLGVEPDTISEVYEPYLLQSGFITRTHRGRVVTRKALEHLGYKTNFGPLWGEE